MRGHEAAHKHEGFRRLAWVVLGASFLTFLMLASPSPAQAQITPVCPTNGPARRPRTPPAGRSAKRLPRR